MKTYLYLLVFALLFFPKFLYAQGCVAIRNMSTCSIIPDEPHLPKGSWLFSSNYRHFKSFRHFRGKHEEPDRVANNTEVINDDYSIILGVSNKITDKILLSASLPFIYIDRSSLYEHDRQNRYHTQTKGIGDLRVVAQYDVLDPLTPAILLIGLGVKAPTGDYNTQDIFNTVNGPELRPVDQSIQPGDGGWGVILQVDWQQKIAGSLMAYAGGMYLLNPRNTNGTRTFRETLSPLLANEAIMSVPDQYFANAGVRYWHQNKYGVGAGVRLEGIPVEDLIGKNDGFRRPGYIVSFEPSLNTNFGRHMLGLNIPIALVRNRTQSLTDQATQAATGNPRHGDAAFADYMILLSYSYQLPGK